MKEIAVVGAGWYGCHIALVLSKRGHQVTLYEKNSEILNELSGNFGVRLHLGLHYPRSKKTRENCLEGYDKFVATYPELVNHHEHSIYGLGYLDADKKPSKVDVKTFEGLVEEHSSYKIIDPNMYGYKSLQTAIDSTEASIVVGEKLRIKFIQFLKQEGVKLKLNTTVNEIGRCESDKITISTKEGKKTFDNIINATSFQQFTPKKHNLFDMEVAYQICVGLIYEDTQKAKGDPIPFIVMDGWYPCLMSYDNSEVQENKWLLYHGKWCVLKSYSSAEEAKGGLAQKLSDVELQKRVEESARSHLNEFYPEFSERFKFVGWKGNVIAKVITEKEFRSAFVFQDQDTRITHIFPGKVPNIFDVEKEVVKLVENDLADQTIISDGNYWFVKGGVLDQGKEEISEKPKDISRNTCFLQASEEVSTKLDQEPSVSSNLILLSSIFNKPDEPLKPPLAPYVEQSHSESLAM